MRGNVPAFELRAAGTLDEALDLLAEEPGGWRPVAGGTDVMVYLEAGALPPGRYLSLWGVEALRFIEVTDAAVAIGALTTYADVRRHPLLAAELPMLGQAAAVTGALAIQSRGTLGGNIVNASPAADTPPALLAYGAEVELISRARGSRRVPYDRFHRGYKAIDLQPDELVRAIHLPRPPADLVHHYRKVGTRRAQAIAKVGLAAVGRVETGRVTYCRLGLSSVAPVPLRAREAEAVLTGARLAGGDLEALVGEARAALDREIAPIDDIRSTRRYRRAVAGNLLEAFIRELAAR